MSEKVYAVPAEWASRAWVDEQKYQSMYKRSVEDPTGFWGDVGKRVDWIKPYTKVKNVSYGPGDVSIKWYEDGTLNVCANCVDRHLKTRGDQVAIIWEGDDPTVDQQITYRQLYEKVCKFANVLKASGVKKGDRVTIYLPMIPEAAYAMLACARIGAIHSVVFGGFSPDSLAGRIEDADSKFVITADEGVRGGRPIPLKKNTDEALAKVGKGDEKVLVVKHTGGQVGWKPERDIWLHEAQEKVSAECPPEEMSAEDPLFILYTSGSTGKPKGVLHTSGGYLVYASMTHQYVFDYHDGDIYWCTADVGWVTGHSYILYGPLANGATTLMFEGVPNYPTASRFWHVVDKWSVNTFYTAPTAIRALMGAGDDFVKRTNRASLRLLGSVGEPINPEAWEWYNKVVGESRCPPRPAAFSSRRSPARPRPSPAPRRDPSSASAPRSSTKRARLSKVRARVILSSWIAGRGRCARSTAITSASCRRTSRRIPARTSRETAAAVTRMATTGSPAALTTSSTSRATALARQRSRARWSRILRSPRPLSSAHRTISRGKASIAT